MNIETPMLSVTELDELKLKTGYWYIATPYTKFKSGLDEAYLTAAWAKEVLLEAGIQNFTAIASGHPISEETGLDPKDYGIWIPFNEQFMKRAHGMVIVTFEGWRDSYGIAEEIKFFTKANKPIFLLDPELLAFDQVSHQTVAPDEAAPIEIDFAGWPDHLPTEGWERVGRPGDVFSKPGSVDNPKQGQGQKKVPFSTVPATVIAELAVAMHEGARKYGRHNFRRAGEILASVYYDANRRHMDAWWEGEDLDPDSKLSHITKAIASLTVLRDAMIQGRFKDDRPPKAPPTWLDSLNAAVREINSRIPDPVPPYIEAA
jgi:hypothetical protein